MKFIFSILLMIGMIIAGLGVPDTLNDTSPDQSEFVASTDVEQADVVFLAVNDVGKQGVNHHYLPTHLNHSYLAITNNKTVNDVGKRDVLFNEFKTTPDISAIGEQNLGYQDLVNDVGK